MSVIPSAGALVIKALKEPTRDRKKVGWPPPGCCPDEWARSAQPQAEGHCQGPIPRGTRCKPDASALAAL